MLWLSAIVGFLFALTSLALVGFIFYALGKLVYKFIKW